MEKGVRPNIASGQRSYQSRTIVRKRADLNTSRPPFRIFILLLDLWRSIRRRRIVLIQFYLPLFEIYPIYVESVKDDIHESKHSHHYGNSYNSPKHVTLTCCFLFFIFFVCNKLKNSLKEIHYS